MLVEITINDNKHNFIMTWAIKCVCLCLPSYLKEKGKRSIAKHAKEIIKEFLESMKVEKKTKNYILENLKVKNCKKMKDFDGFKTFYIHDRFEDGDYFDYMLK